MTASIRMTTIAAALLTATTLTAAPPDLQQVAADAAWLAHVDADGVRASKVMRTVHDHCVANKTLDKCLDRVGKKWGIDIEKDLHGLTAYGDKIARGHGVLIVRAELDKPFLVKKAKRAPGHRMTRYRDYEIHSWAHKRADRKMRRAGAFRGRDTLLLASGVGLLKSALDVLDGRAPSLHERDTPLADDVPVGTLLLARAQGIRKSPVANRHPLCGQLLRFDTAKGERDGRWFDSLAATAEDGDSATRLKTALEGFKAMLWLHLEGTPKLQRLLDHVETSRKANTVHWDFEAPVGKLVDAVPAACRLLEKHHRKQHADDTQDAPDTPRRKKGASKKKPAAPAPVAKKATKRKTPEPKSTEKKSTEKKRAEKKSTEKKSTEKKRAEKKSTKKQSKPATESAQAQPPAKKQPRSDQQEPTARQGTSVLGVVIGKPRDAEAAEVVRVWPDSPAAKAGLQSGDQIVKFGDQKITSPEDLRASVLERQPGDEATLTIQRGDETKELSVTLGGADDFTGRARPRRPRHPARPQGLLSPRPWLGVRIGSGEGRGVPVAAVLRGGPAAEGGLRPGDAILRVDKRRVESASDLQTAIAGYKPGETVRLVVRRDGEQKEIEVELGAFGIIRGDIDPRLERMMERLLERRDPMPEAPRQHEEE